MGCGSCGSGGCGSGSLPAGCKNNGSCGVGGCDKLDVFDWLAGMQMPNGVKLFPYAEVRFKNTRKAFFQVPDELELHVGELVVTDASYGYDVGQITMIGELVRIQMQHKKQKHGKDTFKILRKANQEDIDKWREYRSREKETMLRTRNIVTELKLDMKVSDVEYQGDGTKAIFYYTADERVDFRELIKVLASNFKIRVEMKQIGARQEAGLVGGIGSCGRELCCSTWLTDFRSVSTSAARYQQLAINPVKLAGQCGKLKCCLNYELDSYLDALDDFPKADTKLQTKAGTAFHQKTDVFKGIMWYAYQDNYNNPIPIEKEQVKKIISMNQKGKRPMDLKDFTLQVEVEKGPDFENVVGQDDLTRFDKKKKHKKKKRKNRRKHHHSNNKHDGRKK